jgi:hypothetical protein
MANCFNYTKIVKTFKKSMKLKTNQLISRNPNITAREDAETHFNELYNNMHKGSPQKTFHTKYKNFFDVTTETIKDKILKYASHKSCGQDAIHAIILKALSKSETFLLHLQMLFQLCFDYGYTPKRWNNALVHPVPKAPDAKTITEFRPISLTVMFRRIFESILHTILLRDNNCKISLKLSNNQAGFRSGYSALTHAAISNDLVYEHKNIKRVFIDLKQAYDRVDTDILINKLSQRKLPKHLIRLISSLFLNCTISIQINGEMTNPINMKRGLMQGTILAPLLFNIYIDDLAEKLGNNALLFADDIQIFNSSTQLLQRQLDITHDWCEENKMVIGILKCGSIGCDNMQIGENQIPNVNIYKYLGFPHDRLGIDFDKHYHNRIEKTLKLFNMVKPFMKTWNEVTKLYIYKSFLRPTLEFGLPLLFHHYKYTNIIGKLQEVHAKLLKWIIPYSPQTNRIETICGVLNMRDRAEILAANLTIHMGTLNASNPAKIFSQKVTQHPPWPVNIIIPRSMKTPLSNTLLSLHQDNPRISITNLKRRWMESKVNTYSTITYNMIRGNRKGAKPGPIKELYHANAQERTKMIAWRLGASFCYHICPGGHRFTPGCINRPNCLNSPITPLIITETDKFPPNPRSHFNILDHHLNNNNLSEFHDLYQHFETQLTIRNKFSIRTPSLRQNTRRTGDRENPTKQLSIRGWLRRVA